MRAFCVLISTAVIAALPCSNSWAQTTAKGAVIRNGSFEDTLKTPNLWSGTDSDGNLSGFKETAPILNNKGGISEAPMPVSVAVGDLNKDGLLDIAAADPLGYIRIYFNSGSKNAPTFTHGEFTLPFLAFAEGRPPWSITRGGRVGWYRLWHNRRRVIRISLVDVANTGKLDLLAGNYFGDLLLIRNSGTPNVPRYDQPPTIDRVMIKTSKDPNRRWGNVFAPIMYDWNGDGRPDLLVGEGSFSANNVHLLLNEGSAASPSFNDEKRQPLALGEGREQLSPTLADFDGNGKVDILVTDSDSLITVYLRPDNWKPGDVIHPRGYVAKSGGLTQKTPDDPAKEKKQAYSVGSGVNTITAGDLNNDGLFDLVIGRNDGRIAWAPNVGTKENPKFETPKNLVGAKPTPSTWLQPSQWDISTGVERGNFYSYATVVGNEDDPDADPQNGKKALKFGYSASPNKIIPRPSVIIPAIRNFTRDSDSSSSVRVGTTSSAVGISMYGQSNQFVINQRKFDLAIGKTYNLSFKVKGAKVANANVTLGWRGHKILASGRKVEKERGAVTIVGRETLEDHNEMVMSFNASNAWSTVTRDVKIEFLKNNDLNTEEKTSGAIINISFELAAPDGFLYIDDVKLIPKD